MNDKKPIGRPPGPAMPEAERKRHMLKVRLNDAEMAHVDWLANDRGLSRSELICELLGEAK